MGILYLVTCDWKIKMMLYIYHYFHAVDVMAIPKAQLNQEQNLEGPKNRSQTRSDTKLNKSQGSNNEQNKESVKKKINLEQEYLMI